MLTTCNAAPPAKSKMTDWVLKGFGPSKQLSLNKFFDPSTPSMRKGRDREKKTGKIFFKKREKKWKRLMIIVATTSLPAVDRPNADRWNAARSCEKEKTDENSAHYVICQQSTARTTTAGTPHACANLQVRALKYLSNMWFCY